MVVPGTSTGIDSLSLFFFSKLLIEYILQKSEQILSINLSELLQSEHIPVTSIQIKKQHLRTLEVPSCSL